MITVELKPNGLIRTPVAPRDYTFGSGKIAGDILQRDGDWNDYLPKAERQDKNGIESFFCTNFGTNEALETLLRRQFGIRANLSDRYSAIMSGTTQRGNSPHKVIETIRNYAGAVPEEALPYTDDIKTWPALASGVTFPMKLDGLSWLKGWEIKHEWVEGHEAMIDALKFSPLGASFQAWSEQGGLYVKTGPDTHWAVIYGYKKGRYWKVRDTYTPYEKRIAWDTVPEMCKRYSIQRRPSVDTTFVVRAMQGLLGIY